MNDDLDLFCRINAHCADFSDQELNRASESEEISSLQKLAADTAAALTAVPEVDLDCEWKKFADRQFNKDKSSRAWGKWFGWRNVAAVGAILVVSAAVIAGTFAVHRSFIGSEEEIEARKTEIVMAGIDSTAETTHSLPSTQVEVFKNVPLDSVLTAIAAFHGAEVVFNNGANRGLRLYYKWDKSMAVEETVAQLDGFGQFDIKYSGNVITVD